MTTHPIASSTSIRDLLLVCKQWHQGDKWRESADESELTAWQLHMNALDEAIASHTAQDKAVSGDERAQFEAWILKRAPEASLKGTTAKVIGWYYFDDEIDLAWDGWKARAASPQLPVAQMGGDASFLNWVADRFVHVYGEPENVDFVLKLRRLAASHPSNAAEEARWAEIDDLFDRSGWPDRHANAVQDAPQIKLLVEALQFYANGEHFMMHDPDVWDTVSGEPANFYEDESNTATVEDGSVAKMALDKFNASTAATVPQVAQSVPEGWKLVPVEPTEAMRDAGLAHYYKDVGDIYTAMLTAAPQPVAASPSIVPSDEQMEEILSAALAEGRSHGVSSTVSLRIIGAYKNALATASNAGEAAQGDKS